MPGSSSRIGASPPPLLCVGHSHVACVARAAEATGHPFEALNLWNLPGAVLKDSGEPRFSSPIERRLREHDGPVFSMIGGAAHNVLGLLVHSRRFDFVLPSHPQLPLDPEAELIPSLAVQGILESQMSEYLALMSLIRGFCTGRMFHVEPPPPTADAKWISANMRWKLFANRRREISPSALRYKLWRLHSQLLSRWCAGAGVVMLPVPEGTTDADGFMREPFLGDGVHANDRYGALVLEQMKALA